MPAKQRTCTGCHVPGCRVERGGRWCAGAVGRRVIVSPRSPVAESCRCYRLAGHLRGPNDRDHTVVDIYSSGWPSRGGAEMISTIATGVATGAVLTEPVMSTAARLRTDRAQLALGPPGRWQPRSLRAATVSTSDARMRDVGRVDADPLLVRLGELAPGDVNRIAARASAIEWYLPMAIFRPGGSVGRCDPLADVTQVAAIGLIKAVDRFDAARGVPPFASYACRPGGAVLRDRRHRTSSAPACAARLPPGRSHRRAGTPKRYS